MIYKLVLSTGYISGGIGIDNLSFKIGDLTLMYEHKRVDPDDFFKEVSCIKSDSVESIMDLIIEHEEEHKK